MIDRPAYFNQLSLAVKRSPVTALVGPRQCGKTTLARLFGQNKSTIYFDLESPPDLNRLQNPHLILNPLHGLVIIDEAQVMPDFSSFIVVGDTALNVNSVKRLKLLSP